MEKKGINRQNLFRFLSLPGISGREQLVLEEVKKKAKFLHLEYQYDNLGSLTILKKSKNLKNTKKVLIDAHVDQVGLEVIGINEQGYLIVETKGYIWPKSILLQRLRVWSTDFKKSYPGVAISPKIDLTELNNNSNIEIKDILIDVGAKSIDDVAKMKIAIGSVIIFDQNPEFSNQALFSQALDNRLGVYLLFQLLDFIKSNQFDYDLYCTFSVQEEVGLRGARTSAYKFNPDLAIVVDVSPVNDYNSSSSAKGKLGNGTILRFLDALTICDPKIISYLKNIFKKNKIKYQNYFGKGATNSGIIHLTKNGIKVIPIGLLARNLHTGTSVCDLSDLLETQKTLEIILKDLDNKKIDKLIKMEEN